MIVPPPPPQIIGVDSETGLIQAGLLTPPLVCVTTAKRVGPGPNDFETGLMNWADGVDYYRQALSDPNTTIIIHNAPFDLATGVAEDQEHFHPFLSAAGEDLSLLPLVFDAIDQGRAICTVTLQKLIDVALGQRKFRRYRGKVVKTAYFLKDLIEMYYEEIIEKEDTWRKSYYFLRDVPVEKWPVNARRYAIYDAVLHLRLFEAQQRKIKDTWGELPNQVEQQRANWVLALMSMWGVRADQKAVDVFIGHCQEQIDKMREALAQTNILKPDGSRYMAEIKRRIVESFHRKGMSIPMTPPSPRFPEGQVKTDEDTLRLTDDPKLHVLADSLTFQKHLGQWGPVVRAAVKRPVCCRYNVLVDNGRTSCVAKGTLIDVVRDVSKYPKGIPIENVQVGDLVYSYDENRKLCLRKVLRVFANGRKEIVRVHWEGTGKKREGDLFVTADHRLRKTDGTYIEAAKLQFDDRLMALSRGVTRTGYAQLWPTGMKEIAREHQFIFEQINGYRPEQVHHDDENKLNNLPSNLIGMSKHDHHSYHAKKRADGRREEFRDRAKQMWKDGVLKPRYGKDNPAYRELTEENATKLLKECRWSIYLAAKAWGTNDRIFNGKLVELGFDLDDLKRRANDARLGERQEYAALARAKRKKKAKKPRNNHRVLFVEHLGLACDVYDLEIEETHNFIAGEICVHNCSGGEGQEGTNIQNPPRKGDVRPCFIPRFRWVYCSTDADTVEMRANAQNAYELVGWSRMKDALWDQFSNGGPDLHVRLAANVAAIPKEVAHELHKTGDADFKNTRQMSKHGNFAFLGGAGGRRFAGMAHGFGIALTQAYNSPYEVPGDDACPVFMEEYDPATDKNKLVTKWVSFEKEVQRALLIKEMFLETWPEERIIFRLVKQHLDKTDVAKQLQSNRIRGDCTFTSLSNSLFSGRVADSMKEILWNLGLESYLGRCTTKHVHGGDFCSYKGRSCLYGSRTAMFLHDEPIMEHPEETAAERAEKQRIVVVDGLQAWMKDVPVTSTAVLMRRWQKGAEPGFLCGCGKFSNKPTCECGRTGKLVPVKPEKVKGADGKSKVKWIHDLGEDLQIAA